MTTWPVGAQAEREQALDHLPGKWFDANPFMSKYQINNQGNYTYHTGADLNLNVPYHNADYHSALYAVEDGTVSFAGSLGGSWGNVIVVKHSGFYTRYGHVENLQVRTGDPVTEGTIIAFVGDGSGYYRDVGAHLHFDISITDVLKTNPGHWPGLNAVEVRKHYTAPIPFLIARIKDNIVVETDTPVTAKQYKVTDSGVRFRYGYRLPTPNFGNLSAGTIVDGYDLVREGFRLCGYNGQIGFISDQYLTPV